MTKGDHGMDVMMGDLVLTEDEVNPVMSALLSNGLEVTALHNHFFWEQPRIFYMHVHGMGTAADLAKRLSPALALIPKPATPPATSAPAPALPPLDTAALAKIIGHAVRLAEFERSRARGKNPSISCDCAARHDGMDLQREPGSLPEAGLTGVHVRS